jgi:hypothetical protein
LVQYARTRPAVCCSTGCLPPPPSSLTTRPPHSDQSPCHKHAYLSEFCIAFHLGFFTYDYSFLYKSDCFLFLFFFEWCDYNLRTSVLTFFACLLISFWSFLAAFACSHSSLWIFASYFLMSFPHFLHASLCLLSCIIRLRASSYLFLLPSLSAFLPSILRSFLPC